MAMSDIHGETALHIAATTGYSAIMRVLLSVEANAADTNANGAIALHNAALNGVRISFDRHWFCLLSTLCHEHTPSGSSIAASSIVCNPDHPGTGEMAALIQAFLSILDYRRLCALGTGQGSASSVRR